MVLDFLFLRANPMVGSCGVLAPDSRPGHIVRRHLLTILKEAEWTSMRTKNGKNTKWVRRKWREFREIVVDVSLCDYLRIKRW
jgi:hypothetical protein